MSWSLNTNGRANKVAAQSEENLKYATDDNNNFPIAEREACKRVVEIIKGIANQDPNVVLVVNGSGSMSSDKEGITHGSFKLEISCIKVF